MRIKDEIIPILEQREKGSDNCLTELPNYFTASPTILAEIKLLSRDLQDTIRFLDEDCTADQLSWISEIADSVSENLQSWDFIDALHRAAERFPEETQKYNLISAFSWAEDALNLDVYRERYPDA